jgi:acetoacetyl-CoA synthetase
MRDPLWVPDPARVAGSAMERFRRRASAVTGEDLVDTRSLHQWSVTDPGTFWSLTWDDVGLLGDKGGEPLRFGKEMWEAEFFPGGSLSLAENLLDGRGAAPAAPALVYHREDGRGRVLTWEELRRQVLAFAGSLTELGVGVGDRVAAWMPHLPETIVAALGAAMVGAVFTSTSADFGVAGVVDRFGQVEPKVLVAADGYLYAGKPIDRRPVLREIVAALPSLQATVVVNQLTEAVPEVAGGVAYQDFLRPASRLSWARFPFSHPLYILYSSGTTGAPKCIVHRAGGVLLKHMQEQQHHCDLRAGDRLFYFTTCGWMMWNWLVSGLASGATLVLYDGNPFHPHPAALFDLVDELGINLLGVSAKYLDALAIHRVAPAETHRLGSLRTITSTGSPLSADGFRYVYERVKSDIHLASISGGTDLCGSFVMGDPTRPVFAGEIQGPTLGMAVDVFDEEGHPVRGVPGELVCTRPFPSMPLGFYGVDGDRRYRETYFARYPGVWTHGDYIRTTDNGGYVILGRSDATLNAGGVRIGTAEIYRVVDAIPGVAESVAIGQRWGVDTRIVLFVRLVPGTDLSPELAEEVRRRLRTEESPRHVPAVIVAVDDLPRTRSGKTSELAVAAAINGDPIRNLEALENPEVIEEYRRLAQQHPALADRR